MCVTHFSGRVAQLVEQWFSKPTAIGSIPVLPEQYLFLNKIVNKYNKKYIKKRIVL